jgi:predicted small lipoprotein YifL
MNRHIASAFLVLSLAAFAGCGQKPGPTPTPTEGKVNAGSTVAGSSSDVPTGQANAEDPKTQTNSGRPDSAKDLKPGTDGNTNSPTN